jgi:hypothetical protein
MQLAIQGDDAVRQMAHMNTIDSISSRFGCRWDVNKIWSTITDYTHEVNDITQADGTKGKRNLDRISFYLSEQNYWRIADIVSLLFIHQMSSDLMVDTLYLTVNRRLGKKVSLQGKARVENNNFDSQDGSDFIRYVPGLSLNADINPMWSFSTEAEYSIEDHTDGSSISSVWTRFNMTSVF